MNFAGAILIAIFSLAFCVVMTVRRDATSSDRIVGAALAAINVVLIGFNAANWITR